MGHIDDPLDQVKSQYPKQGQSLLALTTGVGSALVAWLSETAVPGSGMAAGLGATLAITNVTASFFTAERVEARAEAFRNELVSTVQEAQLDIRSLASKVEGPDAEDALMTAIRLAMSSARLDKARRFGRVIGTAASEENPVWAEVAEYIRSLEEISDADLEALKILWKFQRQAYRIVDGSGRHMSTDANDYTENWKNVVGNVQKKGLSKDEWASRCARLMGFGMAVTVEPNAGRQAPDDQCYRLTGRGVRLMQLLGRDVNVGSYPRVRTHPVKGQVTVDDEDEDRALEREWT